MYAPSSGNFLQSGTLSPLLCTLEFIKHCDLIGFEDINILWDGILEANPKCVLIHIIMLYLL